MAEFPSEVEESFEEAGAALEANATDFTASIDVSVAGDLADETVWNGSNLQLEMTEMANMSEEVANGLMPDVYPDAAFASDANDLVNGVETLMGGAFGNLDLEAVSGEAADVAGDVAKIEMETEAAEMAAKSSKLEMAGKIIMYGTGIIFGLDWIAGKLAAIIMTMLDATKTPDWAKNMTEGQKEELKNVSAALPKLSIIMQSWVSQWKTFKDRNVDFGKLRLMINSTPHEVPVMLILFYAFRDMDGMITNTKTIFSRGVDSLSTADIIMAINNIFVVLADAITVFKLKKESNYLTVYKFPPQDDKETIDKIIMSFRNGEAKVRAVGVKYIRFAATNAVTTYLQVKITRDIYKSIQDVVLPQMRTAAKAAFTSVAKHHMDSEKDAIRALAWIPGAGISMARDKIAKEQKVASEEGTVAAKKAAENKLNELRPQIISEANLAAKKHTDVDKNQLRMIAKLAIDSAMGQVKASVKKSVNKK